MDDKMLMNLLDGGFGPQRPDDRDRRPAGRGHALPNRVFVNEQNAAAKTLRRGKAGEAGAGDDYIKLTITRQRDYVKTRTVIALSCYRVVVIQRASHARS